VLENGVDRLQYRRTSLTDQERVRELEEVSSLCSEHDVPLIVNDRPDLALVAKADGVHLGEDDLPVEPVKNRWPNLIVGATRRVEDAPRIESDYLGVGPVFPSGTKSVGHDPSGWEAVEEFLDRADRPVYAIGGITPERCKGIPGELAGVCTISSVWDRDNPVYGIQKLRDRLPD
jgi:thiamine-phosphate pyrophosphorylase